MTEQVVLLRTSERKSYKTCRQQWWWAFVDNLESIETGAALRFGDLTHQALGGGPLTRQLDIEPWYKPGRKRGQHPALTFEAIYRLQVEQGGIEFSIVEEEESVDALELGIAVLNNYVDVYGDDSRYEVVAPEMTTAVPIYHKGKLLCYYCLTLDAVVKDLQEKQFGFLEHKTAASISTRHLRLDEQAGSYWTFGPPALQRAGFLKRGQDLDFILYNFLRKARPDTRPQDAQGRYLNKPSKQALLDACAERHLDVPKAPKVEDLVFILETAGIDPAMYGEVSKSQPPPYFLRERVYRDEEDRIMLERRVRAEVWEMAMVRAGKLPVYKNPSSAYPNQNCSACEFSDMCELHETGSNWEELRDLTMRRWDPYETYRQAVEEVAS